ncbi:pyridoxal 5'-phosphate synthase glutaminase subunit PdxT [Ktedonosporobacter rubrisoli]|uniref:Pyridoxal 5'-phosphate synthase subunit PdxT n=1 Tax=Ktedonosporobacter rubrisoli TaxID=2509675 RepID=A0A4P6JYM5_KTERU|nr:pyridoxal 5'-phosphate synthase glutaminase subunit PdxT [Ktedonosporobacter rubrisoli]QBD80550.1 pyridoxal 5'-phosphate synthase glutaminase subunit PdxT [Ktedonosporobacter rubrisoli]
MERRNSPTRIGVLALQGDFEAHLKTLTELGVEGKAIRLPEQLQDLDGIIIPGGESTTIGKLMIVYGLQEILQRKIHEGFPVWGTCAGMILLAKETDNALAGQPLLASMNIRVRRNAFGSQRESFETDLSVPALGEAPFHAFFIRGPAVEWAGPEVEVLATLDDGRIVAVREGNLLGTAFHPEVPRAQGQRDSRFHQYFLRIVQGVKG